MKPLSRGRANKTRSAAKFRKSAGRTKAANINTSPMRGGIRL